MGSRLNYLDTHSSRQRGQIHSHTHTQTHTPFLFGILPCLPHCSAECFPLPLSYALPVSNYLPLFDFLLLFSLSILSFFSFFSPPFPHNNSFLSACCDYLSVSAALISPSTVVFLLSFPGLSSVVISHTLLLSMSLPSELSAKMSLHLFMSLCTPPHSVSSIL